MIETELTEHEIEKLTEEIEYAVKHRKADIRKFSIMLPACVIIASVLLVIQTDLAFMNFIFPLSLACLIMIGIPLLLVWTIGKKPIQNLEQDLEAGYKIEGTSKAISVNRLNRNVRLEDGNLLNVLEQSNKDCKVGEFIEYKISKSREVVFECRKTTSQQ